MSEEEKQLYEKEKKKAALRERRRKKMEIQAKRKEEGNKLVDAETNIKKLKDELIFRLQLVVEYNHQVIIDSDWNKIYQILDEKLLGEIFEERDAIHQCCNIHCARKLSKSNPQTEYLMTLHSNEESKSDFLHGKVVKEKQSYYYCSPKCRNESDSVIAKVKANPENYIFKDLKDFAFLQNYEDTRSKYVQMVSEITQFKQMCQTQTSIAKAKKAADQLNSKKANEEQPKIEEKKNSNAPGNYLLLML